LFRKSNCDFCDEIEEALKEESIAYNVVNIEKNKVLKHLPKEAITPIIKKDDNKLIYGTKKEKDYLDNLKKIVKLWRKYQVDVCYIDDGEIKLKVNPLSLYFNFSIN